MNSQPWIRSSTFDVTWILSPALLAVVFVMFFHPSETVPLWAWVAFVLGIDVAHVYSTIFRTYFHGKEFERRRSLYVFLPLLLWITGIFLYSMGPIIFWRCIAYVAVFHFVRQQYGFLRIYSRHESSLKKLDAVLIYLATFYPIIYWHANMPRNFNWFVEGDFISGLPGFVAVTVGIIYLLVFALYIGKEYLVYQKSRVFNIPKNILIFSTALSWYVGIVLLNGDMAFTATNVISHGIPYIALIWVFGNKEWTKSAGTESKLFSLRFIPVFVMILFWLAYMEEGLWAGFVWREHLSVFGPFENLPKILDKSTLSWLVPLLALPQVTHYVLDGFIWKLKDASVSAGLNH